MTGDDGVPAAGSAAAAAAARSPAASDVAGVAGVAAVVVEAVGSEAEAVDLSPVLLGLTGEDFWNCCNLESWSCNVP